MCGICGAITQPDPNIIKALILANERRGDKSSGIAYRIGESVSIFKDTCNPTEFVKSIRTKKINEANLILAHARMPSYNSPVTKKNAHPFRYNSIVGVHNGIISNHSDIKYSGEVDSQAIFHLLSLAKNDFTQVFPQLMGSMTIAWINDGDPNLYLLKHINPLAYAVVDKTLYFTSDANDLRAVLQAAGKPSKVEEVDDDLVYTITPDLQITKTLVTFKTGWNITKDDKEDTQLQLPARVGLGDDVDRIYQPTKEEYRYPWDRTGTKAPMAMTRNGSTFCMRPIMEKYHLFYPDGNVNKKAMKKKAKHDLISLLGEKGYELIKDVKDETEFSRALNTGFGCHLCGYVSHHLIWYNSKSGLVYCNLCAIEKKNQWILTNSKQIYVRREEVVQ